MITTTCSTLSRRWPPLWTTLPFPQSCRAPQPSGCSTSTSTGALPAVGWSPYGTDWPTPSGVLYHMKPICVSTSQSKYTPQKSWGSLCLVQNSWPVSYFVGQMLISLHPLSLLFFLEYFSLCTLLSLPVLLSLFKSNIFYVGWCVCICAGLLCDVFCVELLRASLYGFSCSQWHGGCGKGVLQATLFDLECHTRESSIYIF